jgi:hypothetical protein
LLCDPADNGGFLIGGTCVLPDAVLGQPYQGHLVTSHKADGTLSIVAGAPLRWTCQCSAGMCSVA